MIAKLPLECDCYACYIGKLENRIRFLEEQLEKAEKHETELGLRTRRLEDALRRDVGRASHTYDDPEEMAVALTVAGDEAQAALEDSF